MSIIDQARDVAEHLRNHQIADAWDAADTMAMHFAKSVARAAELADELHSQGERLGKSTYVHERAEGSGYTAASARIRAALEGDEQPPHIGTVSSKEAEVDRWLAERDRQMRAEGWDEGYADARDDEHEHRPGLKNTNPHKEKP